jgi:hypothetical protein
MVDLSTEIVNVQRAKVGQLRRVRPNIVIHDELHFAPPSIRAALATIGTRTTRRS